MKGSKKMNYYKILKLKKNATLSEIKESYKILKKEYKKALKEEELAELEEAFKVLSNSDLREEYDKKSKVTSNNKKEKSQSKIANIIITVLGIIAVIGGVFIISETTVIPETTNTSKELTNVTYSEFTKFLQGNTKTVVIIGRQGCSWCQKYNPILKKVNGKYDLDMKYLSTDNFTTEEYYNYLTIDTTSADEGIGTPITMIISEGKIIDRIDGYVEQSYLETFLKNNGIIS